ncbi:MAG: hypothetical protein H7321_04325 [Bacteroidia bacterium]|nr:hypothetical protein [Bacteroidia bacterium]
MKQLIKHRFFPWLIVLLLAMSNIVSYKISKQYFRNAGVSFEGESVKSNLMGSGSRLIDKASEIMRFFKGPEKQ